MKTHLLFYSLLFIGFGNLTAQRFEANTNAKTLILESGGIKVEGHTGKSIIIEEYTPKPDENEGDKDATVNITGTGSVSYAYSTAAGWPAERKKDDRKKGLTVLNPEGLKDNTGFDLFINDNGTTVELRPVSRNCCKNVVVKIPITMNIKGNINGIKNQNPIIISRIQGEIDLSVQYNKIIFEDLSGPIIAKTTYGDVEGSLNQTIKAPISIISAYGLIDLTLQPAPKVNVDLNTPWGNAYVPTDLTIEMTEKGDAQSYKQPKIKGKINGGGPLIELSANYGNVYLRTK